MKLTTSKAISPVIAAILLLSITVVVSVLVFNGVQEYTQTTQTILGGENALQNSITIKTLFDNTLFLNLERGQNISALLVKDSKGNEMCNFANPRNINDSLLIHYTFDNLTFNGSDYFVQDVSGNGRDALMVSEGRWQQNNFTAAAGTNSTYIYATLNYKFIGNDTHNGCYVMYGNQSSRIIDDVFIPTYNREFYLETPLTGMTSGEVFGYTCNATNFFQVNEGKIYLDGLDDHFFVENSTNFIETYMEVNDSYSVAIVLEKDLVDSYHSTYGAPLSTRSNACSSGPFTNFRLGYLNIRENASDSYYVSNWWNYNKKYYTMIVTFESLNATHQNLSYTLNGDLNSTITTITSEAHRNGSDLVFGYIRGCGNNYYKGYYDEVRIYNRTLSREEAENLHWYLESNRGAGDYRFDLFSCNLEKGENYDVQIVSEGITEKKRFYYR